MAITKADLARAVHDRHGGITRREATALVDSIFDILKNRLARGERILLGELGAMETAERKDRRGRRPASGRRPPARILRYYPSPALRKVKSSASPVIARIARRGYGLA